MDMEDNMIDGSGEYGWYDDDSIGTLYIWDEQEVLSFWMAQYKFWMCRWK